MKLRWIIAIIVAGVVVVLLALTLPRYYRDIRVAHERVKAIRSQLIETACGLIEYATLGEGYPVIVVHGIVGGFDQGLEMARSNLRDGFRSIAVSRFGYLGTPLPDDPSPAAQADAYACLLDALDIQQAAILGLSAGGTSAIQFALRHPDRCSGLVLVSSNAPSDSSKAPSLPPEWVMKIIFKSDFAFWLMITYARSSMLSMVGVPEGLKTQLTPEEKERIFKEVLQTCLPVSLRTQGILNDLYVSNPDINRGYPLEEIAVPTLIIHATDDPLVPFTQAQSMANKIPGAKLVTLDGGHLLLGHGEKVRAEIAEFLKQHTRADAEK